MKRKIRESATLRLGPEKVLALGMIQDVLLYRYGVSLASWSGTLERMGKIAATNDGLDLGPQLRALAEIGEIYETVRRYSFVGRVQLLDGKSFRFDACCSILQHPTHPRAARASYVLKYDRCWYEFHYKRDFDGTTRKILYLPIPRESLPT